MTAILRSNSGQSEVMVDLVQSTACAHDAGFESSVSIRAEHWDGDHSHPTAISIEGLWLRADGLRELLDHIASWTNRPLDQLISERLDGSFDLARLPSQRFSITFGTRPDTITQLNPVVSILLAAGALRSEFHFVTDQSCLAMFSTELGSQLRESQLNVF
jgi:hypothetical protein